MKTISIILPVFNGLEFTKKCIRNLTDAISFSKIQSYIVNVVIVDDGSNDGTSAWIKAQSFKNLYLLNGDGNLWWSGSVNLGAEYAVNTLKSDFLLLWNNDIVAEDNYFNLLFQLLDSREAKNTIIGSKIYTDSELKTIWSMGGMFDPFTGEKFMKGFFETDNHQYDEPLDVDWLPGMGTVIPVSVIESIGLWDNKNFPQYHGDSDFTYRAKLQNFNIRVYPSLKIWNDVSNTGIKHNLSYKGLYRQLTGIKSNYNIKKNILFYRKYVKSYRAYFPLFRYYTKMLGGFVKWKILYMFNIKKGYAK